MKKGVLLCVCLQTVLMGCGGSSGSGGGQPQYSIGGTVTGLNGTLVLQSSNGEELSISADGEFSFDALLAAGAGYQVAVLGQPAGDYCSISNAAGTATANVTNLHVSCRLAPPSTPNLSFSAKTFQFSWLGVAGADYYRLFENPDGVSGYSQVGGDITTISSDLRVSLWQRFRASYVIQACDDRGCGVDSSAVFVEDDLADAIGYVKSTNTGSVYGFGDALALSSDGSTLAVGEGGAVQIYSRADNSWSSQAVVQSSNWSLGDEFGGAIALSDDGNTLVVGASREDSNATGIDGDETDNNASSSGAAYVFTRSSDSWSQQAYLKASNAEADDRFGAEVALSADGNSLAVGAVSEDSSTVSNETDNSASASGAVYVFTRVGGSWSQQAYLKASNTDVGDSFGTALSFSANGDTLAIGAIGEASSAVGIGGDQNNGTALGAGAVYVYIRSGSSWSQQAYVKASNTDAGDRFGIALSLSGDGDVLAVGANSEDSAANGVNGDQQDNNASGAGAVYLFARTSNNWSQRAYLKASNVDAADNFGLSLALSADGDSLAVGASGEDGVGTGFDGNETDNSALASGAVYMFEEVDGVWSKQAYVKASNTDAGDGFGNEVALSSDGDTLAVGATGEASSAAGFGGDQQSNSEPSAGAVYLY